MKVYLDTSSLGGFFDKEDPKRVETANLLFALLKNKELDGFISRVVVMEIMKAPEEFREELKEHMVNIRVKRMVNAINLRLGYKMIDIVAPEEVIRYGEVEP